MATNSLAQSSLVLLQFACSNMKRDKRNPDSTEWRQSNPETSFLFLCFSNDLQSLLHPDMECLDLIDLCANKLPQHFPSSVHDLFCLLASSSSSDVAWANTTKMRISEGIRPWLRHIAASSAGKPNSCLRFRSSQRPTTKRQRPLVWRCLECSAGLIKLVQASCKSRQRGCEGKEGVRIQKSLHESEFFHFGHLSRFEFINTKLLRSSNQPTPLL